MADFSFQNKTVVFIIKVCVLAGAERQSLGLARFLKEKYNCKIHFIATHSNEQTEEFEKFAKACGVDKIHFYGTPSLSIRKGFSFANLKKTIRALRYIYKVKKEVKKLKPDVIIPFMNFASKLSALIYKDVGAKYTFWHELGEANNYYYDLLEKKAVEKIPFFCANATDGLDILKSYYGVKDEKCNLLTQYVSFNRVDHNVQEIKKEFNISENSFVFGMVAHYRDQKHPELLLEAFSKVAFEKNVHLIFLGNKDNDHLTLAKYNGLVRMAKELGVENKVKILSGIPVEKVLSVIDVGVLVSAYEGVPTVLLEYMAYGKPIIATNHPGCIQLMGDSEFLVPKKDVGAIVIAMNKLYDNPKICKEIGERNIQEVKKYSLPEYVTRIEYLINKYK